MEIKNYRKNEEMLKELISLNLSAKVGILADPDGNKAHKADQKKKVRDSDGTVTNSSETLLDVAIVHEFGLGNQKERSFLRSTADSKKTKAKINKIAERELANSNDPDKTIRKIAAAMVGEVKKKFTNNDWPALDDPTRGGKNPQGSARPLVDTGQLRASIAYEIIEGDL